MVTETNHMGALQAHVPKPSLPWTTRALIALLLCLEIPVGLFFFPLAAVLVLTGILAPLGMMSFSIATKPYALAMRFKAAGRSEPS